MFESLSTVVVVMLTPTVGFLPLDDGVGSGEGSLPCSVLDFWPDDSFSDLLDASFNDLFFMSWPAVFCS